MLFCFYLGWMLVPEKVMWTMKRELTLEVSAGKSDAGREMGTNISQLVLEKSLNPLKR
jgi:hypothetical protein